MKTTIEIPDPLMDEARRIARERGITLKSLIETALRRVIEADQEQRVPFKLRKHTVGGQGLHPDLKDASWDEIRQLSYGDRGG